MHLVLEAIPFVCLVKLPFDTTFPIQVRLKTQTLQITPRQTGDARFRVIRLHAKGGLGEVSLARDTELNRDVALKEIQSRYADDDDSRNRFMLEAEVTGSLEHPGIVPVYGLGQYPDGRPFYVMRFIKGDSLKQSADRFHARDQTAEQPISYHSVGFRELLSRFTDVCDAVEYAHSRGVLHRDLKPGNIMLGKYGETLVVDWGLAKVLGERQGDHAAEVTFLPSSGDSSAGTILGSTVGTPSYMSPEQAEGRLDELGPASDVYSLGATMYYVMTGSRPTSSNELSEILEEIKRGGITRPRERQPKVPPALEAICLKAMALRPEDRYPSPSGIASDIQRWLADEPVSAYSEPLLLRADRWVRRHKTAAVGTITAVVALIIAATYFIGRQLQHANSVREQVAVLLNEGRSQNRHGNVDGAIRLLALASGSTRSSGSPNADDQAARELDILIRYRDFHRQADDVLAGGIHGMDAKKDPDPIVTKVSRALGVYNIEADTDWQQQLAGDGLSAKQIAATKHAAAHLLIMKAVRLALFDSKGDAAKKNALTALRLLDRAEQLEPLTMGMWMCRMLFHRRVGANKLADTAGERMTAIAKSGGKQTALDYYLLGSVTLHILKRPESAVGLYEQSLALEPDYFGAAMGLYFAHQAQEKPEDELVALNRCLAIKSKDPNLYFFRGITLFQLGRYKAALRDLDRNAGQQNRAATTQYWRGRCNIMLEQWKEADAAFTRAIELDKTYLDRLSWRALCRAKIPSRVLDAVKDAQQVLKSNSHGGGDIW